jgi:Recombinase zinc beta ribbon domain
MSKGVDGSLHVQTLPRAEWPFLFQDAHPGYLSWEEYEANIEQLQHNRQAHGGDRRHGPAREGPALLQGLVICGICGNRMTVRYHQAQHGTRLIPEYVCQKEQIEHAEEPLCQHILGAGLDAAIADLLLAQFTPLSIETAMQVYEELQTQAEAAQRLRDQQLERAGSATELAQRRFLRVDPENRLVASVLEGEWNARLQEYTQLQQELAQQQEVEQRRLSTQQQQAVLALVEDFPRIFRDERTSDRDRKRMVRLLIEDVTLRKTDVITAQIRLSGGATQTLTIPVSQGRRSAPEVLARLSELLDDYSDAQVAEQLNQRGWRTYEGKPFHATRILSLRRYHHLKDHSTRLRERGMLSASEAARAYGVSENTIRDWGRSGRIPMYQADGRGILLFSPPSEHPFQPSQKAC